MFKATEESYGHGALAANLSLADALPTPRADRPARSLSDILTTKIEQLDLVPDLGQDIGSIRWFRGLATMLALIVGALSLMPEFSAIQGAQAPLPTDAQADELRAQMIMPLALGGDSGRRMAATDAVMPLKAAPERPSIELTATLGQGDSFARLLQRAGVGSGEASQVVDMISSATAMSDIASGTRVDVVLGRRASRTEARPLQSLDFRARFDLALAIERTGPDGTGNLRLVRKPIAVDDTPLRIRGLTGGSIFRAARAAGVPADAAQRYLRVLSEQVNISSIGASDTFDIVIGYRRAATGEVQVGDLMYVGLDRQNGKSIQMLRWGEGGDARWYEASGVGENRGEFARPVPGMISSSYGARRHPVLGYVRMHRGLDFRASYGTPIRATADGNVAFAGRKGGYGNFVQLNHAGGLSSGYGHMSRIAASPGQRVKRGQVIGYVGSTGLSTGPHLHYELYRNGRAINPASVRYTERAQLSGNDLTRFRAEIKRMQGIKVGAALTPMMSTAATTQEPAREIEKIAGLKPGDQVFRP